MSQQFSGRPALVANNLPTAKTVTAATNATPIVATTSTAHGIKTNDIFTISGVGGNLAANGTFIAGSVTSTTVVLLDYPGGTNVAGTSAYTSGGTLQALGFGVTYPIPNDATDALRAATVNVALEALGDRTAYAMYRAGPSGTLELTKVNRAGDTMTGTLSALDLHVADGHAFTSDGTVRVTGGAFIWFADTDMRDAIVLQGRTTEEAPRYLADAAATLDSSIGGGITGAVAATGLVKIATASAHFFITGAVVRIAGVLGTTEANGRWTITVIDATHFTLNGSTFVNAYTSGGVIHCGRRVVLITSPAGNRIITLRQSTSPAPFEGDWFEVTCFLGTSSFTIGLQREGSANYVAVLGDGVGTSPYASSNQVGTARVQVVGGVWRLTAVGGVAFSGSDS